MSSCLGLFFKVRTRELEVRVSWDKFWIPHSCQEEELAAQMCNEQPGWVAAAVGLGEGQIAPLFTLHPLAQGLGFQEDCRYAAPIYTV